MGDLGVRPDIIEKCFNHIEQNRILRVYQRQELKAEQEEAWRLLGARLALLLKDKDNNAVLLAIEQPRTRDKTVHCAWPCELHS